MSRRYRPSCLASAEDVEDYQKGGYHPVLIGDVFAAGRYRVIHKLGFGGFSTVWLARDERLHSYVALKIVVAAASNRRNELHILEYLKRAPRQHPGYKYIVNITDSFTFNGPNGSHLCIVSEVAGPSIVQLSYSPGRVAGSRRLRADLARKVALQTTYALACLHSQGVVHGDFTPLNIVFRLADVDAWSEADVYERFGQPVKEPVRNVHGARPGPAAPTYLVEAPTMTSFAHRWLADEIMVIDFGQSFLSNDPPSDGVGTPLPYSAPEIIFDNKSSIQSDVWALGCSLFEIRAGAAIFASFFGGLDEVVRQIVQTLGRLPEPWWSRWEARHRYFDEDGKPNSALAADYPLREQIQDIGSEDEMTDTPVDLLMEPAGSRLSDHEVDSFQDLLSQMITYTPSERGAAQSLLGHSWFRG